MEKLRIATVVSGTFTVPPPKGVVYAPMTIAADLARGLAARGHNVTFFAPKGSRVDGVRIVDAGLPPLHHRYPEEPTIFRHPDVKRAEYEKIVNLWEQRLVAELYRMERNDSFDVIHSHTPDRTLPLSFLAETPTVFTLHTPALSWHEKIFSLFANSRQHFIALSEAQRASAPRIPWHSTIPNGIVLTRFPFSESAGDGLLFIGRLIPEKGAAEAIRATQGAGERLRLFGPKTRTGSRYWKETIAPQLNDRITYEGMLPYEKTHEAYGKAKATLIPIQWEEPFGLTIIESLACGTPVIAFRRGSVPEIMVDGVTGFIVDTLEEMVEAIGKIGRIDRRACRRHVEEHFTVEKMVNRYEEVFRKIAARP